MVVGWACLRGLDQWRRWSLIVIDCDRGLANHVAGRVGLLGGVAVLGRTAEQ